METTKIIDGKIFKKIRKFKNKKSAKDYLNTVPHAYYRIIMEWNSNLEITEYILYIR